MTDGQVRWYQFTRYDALSACKRCEAGTRHEPWCMFVAPIGSRACQIEVDPSTLTIGDALILHALGLAWDETQTGVSELPPDPCPAVDLMLEFAHLGLACRA